MKATLTRRDTKATRGVSTVTMRPNNNGSGAAQPELKWHIANVDKPTVHGAHTAPPQ